MKQERKMINLSKPVAGKAAKLKQSLAVLVGVQISYSQLFELLYENRKNISECIGTLKK